MAEDSRTTIYVGECIRLKAGMTVDGLIFRPWLRPVSEPLPADVRSYLAQAKAEIEALPPILPLVRRGSPTPISE